MANANFDTVLSTTLNKHRPALIDAIFEARPLTFMLKRSGNIRMIDGGAKIVEPTIVAANTTAGSYSGADTITTTHLDEISASEWDWKQVAVSVNVTGIEEAKNSGGPRIMDLVEAKIQVAQESLILEMNTMFNADGTGNSGKDWEGLVNLVATNANDTTVGGINPTTSTYWASNIDATSEALALVNMTTMFNNVSVGNDTPDFILTYQAAFEAYEAILQANMRYQQTEIGDGGFLNIAFKGRPVMFDVQCDANSMYFLNSKYLKLFGHGDRWFTSTPFVKPTNQDIRIAQILAYGNLISNNRRMLGVLSGLTNS